MIPADRKMSLLHSRMGRILAAGLLGLTYLAVQWYVSVALK